MYTVIKISRVLKRVFSFLVIIPSLLTLVLWVSTTHQGIHLYNKIFGSLKLSSFIIINELFVSMNFSIFLFFIFLFAIQTYWLWQLKQLFGFFAQGQIFTAKNSAYIYRTAILFIMIAFSSVVINGLPSTFLTVNNSKGYILLNIILGVLQVFNILMGSVFLVVALVMDEGRRLQEEIDSTI